MPSPHFCVSLSHSVCNFSTHLFQTVPHFFLPSLTDRQIGRQIGRQTDRESNTAAEKQTAGSLAQSIRLLNSGLCPNAERLQLRAVSLAAMLTNRFGTKSVETSTNHRLIQKLRNRSEPYLCMKSL